MEAATNNTASDNLAENLREVRRISWLGIWLNLFLTALKFFAGIVGHSTVLIADAVNSLSDMVTDIVVLIGSQFWGCPADDDHPYGHAKIETLITMFIGIAVLLVGVGLVYGAIKTLVEIVHGKELMSPTWLPLVVALISMVIKYGFYRLALRVGTRIKSTAVIANAWNHQSDVLASIPAAAAIGLCLLLGNQYAFLDPVGAVVVSFMIMYAAWTIIQPTFGVLLDGGASKEQYKRITELILAFPEVVNLEKLRTRFLGPNAIAVDVHIRVDRNMSVEEAHTLFHRIKHKLFEEDHTVIETSIHIEPARL
ncbi:cation efflux system protein [Planctomycetales bacterium]|nr:cation efflux system protein [Planctomycetales bacterium]